MLCLPPPYGLGEKSVHVSLRAPYEKHFEVRIVAVEMGCPVYIADRVEECIQYSGRYDCLLNMEVDIARLKRKMKRLGGSITDVEIMPVDLKIDMFSRRQPSLSINKINEIQAELGPFAFVFGNPYQGAEVDAEWRKNGGFIDVA